MTVIINPGSGPVANATYENACACIAAFAHEVRADSWKGRPDSECDGRWTFVLKRRENTAEVDMPGLPLERVRYVGEPHQNIWDFPRLYIDGSSWVWEFALGVTFREEEAMGDE